MQCVNCGKETTNPKFCSRSCSATYTNKLNPKRKLERICCVEGCQELTVNCRTSRCAPHWTEYKENKFQNRTIGQYRQMQSVKGKHPSWIHAHIRGFARSWLKHLTKEPCRKCGYSKHVELAHVKAVSDFEDSALLSVVNSEKNVIPLCPNCHWEFDNLPRNGFFTKLLEPREGIEPFDFHPDI